MGEELTIGKAPECDLVVTDDEYLSRRHVRLIRSEGKVVLEDLGSANGTFLRVRRPVALEPGDEILIGTSLFTLEK
jgi:pSer/pThr/pTyr-binding forkhead associated (FHA) protein